MLWLGHASVGYLIAYFLIKVFHSTLLTGNDVNLLLLFGAIAGILPDIDFIFFFLSNKSIKLQRNDTHHKYITHTILFWLIVSLILLFVTGTFFGIYLSIILFLSALSHLILDSLQYEIMFFWPFSKKYYGLNAMPKENLDMKQSTTSYYWKFFWKIYAKNWTFYLELIFLIIVLLVYFRIV